MDFKEFADNLGLEEDEFFQIMELFVETSASDLSKMTAAVDGGDMERVVETAHSIKGASGNLGFIEIREMAGRVEMKARENNSDGLPEAVRAIKEELERVFQSLRAH